LLSFQFAYVDGNAKRCQARRHESSAYAFTTPYVAQYGVPVRDGDLPWLARS
jgi:hypothetical protein